MKWFYLNVISLAFLFSCVSQSDKEPKKVEIKLVQAPKTLTQLDEQLLKVDSLVFVFYTDPYRKDSMQYTRYYEQFSTTDSEIINRVLTGVNVNFVEEQKVRPCRTEGKIWCFSKDDIVQTVYFSQKGPSCSFVYLIKNGLFYYIPFPTDFKNIMRTIKM